MHEYKSLIIIEHKDVINRNVMGGIFHLTQMLKDDTDKEDEQL